MAASLESNHALFGEDDHGPTVRATGLPEDILSPVIAGAFARGVAETFESLAIPALFLDRNGRVLFATTQAKPHLARDLALQAGHLLATTRADNGTLAAFLAEVLHDPCGRQSTRLDASGLVLKSLPVPGHATAIEQLLHAIVVVDLPKAP